MRVGSNHRVLFLCSTWCFLSCLRPSSLPAAGKALTYTCYQMYERTATGLSAEWVSFNGRHDFTAGASFNILRPEAIESIFILHQLTGDHKCVAMYMN